MRAEQADDVSPPCRLLNMKLRICHARYVARGRSEIAQKKSDTCRVQVSDTKGSTLRTAERSRQRE